jgi:hypothetical protein
MKTLLKFLHWILRANGKSRIYLLIFALVILSSFASATMPIAHFLFNNDYTDTTNINNLTAGGTGNSFDNSIKMVGTHSLLVTGSGWATRASSNIPLGNADYSESLWIRLNVSNNYNFPLDIGGPTVLGVRSIWYYGHSDGYWQIIRSLDDWATTYHSNAGQWFLLTYTYNASNKLGIFYVNGTYFSNHTFVSNNNLTASQIKIGARIQDNLGTRSHIDDVRYYNTTIPASVMSIIIRLMFSNVMIGMLAWSYFGGQQ